MLCFFKKWRGFCLAALAVILSVSLWPDPAPALQDVEKLDKSVVKIIKKLSPRKTSSGTGFIINDRIIGTNRHVAGKAGDKVKVYLSHSTTPQPAKVIFSSVRFDIAILKTERPLSGGMSAILSSAEIKKGNEVYALGFPGLAEQTSPSIINPTLTSGIVGRIFLGVWSRDGDLKVIQHSAAVNPGNSGGPLFDDCGRVVGINTKASLSGRIVRDKAGKILNVMAGQGILFSSHISELIKILKQNSISYKSSATKCVPPSSGADSQARRQVAVLNNLLNQLTQQMIIGGSIGGVLLLAALALALRKPRARIIHAAKQVKEQVSGYSRKVEDGVSRALGGKAGAPHHLVLAGFDQGGHALRLKLDRRQLADRWGVTIGRAPSLVEQALPGAMISRRHARFLWRDQGYGVEDLNSSQGTFINGEKLEPYREAAFHTGDEISFGDLQLVISKS